MSSVNTDFQVHYVRTFFPRMVWSRRILSHIQCCTPGPWVIIGVSVSLYFPAIWNSPTGDQFTSSRASIMMRTRLSSIFNWGAFKFPQVLALNYLLNMWNFTGDLEHWWRCHKFPLTYPRVYFFLIIYHNRNKTANFSSKPFLWNSTVIQNLKIVKNCTEWQEKGIQF